ncbi:unnamed protein product [Urochloa decumbens]|uniref:F-box domain-containing protein n=1 Tax=Urochloa decumbens TaxID=240449 RepID=A0ABC9F1N7_9POAL
MAPPPQQQQQPAELMEELVGEILLHLPPDEPEHLFRAALVCKPWLRILCDPAFRRRYRAFHGAPPLLGLLHRRQVLEGDPPARFASTTSMPDFPHPGSDGHRTRPLDCRHGRVLIDMLQERSARYLVWDPTTGDKHFLPAPDMEWLIESAAVLCAVDGCDHLDCHGGPFRVVVMATLEYEDNIVASVYSSESDVWSAQVSFDNSCEAFVKHMRDGRAEISWYTPYLQPRRGTLLADAIYFTVRGFNTIVKYEWGQNCLSMIDSPSPDVYDIALMALEDGSLGFACIEGSSLYLWSRKVNSGGAAEWVQFKVIELATIIPSADSNEGPFVVDLAEDLGVILGAKCNKGPFVVGFAEGVGVIFISTGAGLFTIELKSERVRKVDGPGVYFSVLPYMSFYTPDHGRLLSLARTH